MAVYKDKNKTKDGRCYFFQIMKNRKLYKSKRFLKKEEAKQAEAIYILNNSNPSRKMFAVVADAYFDNLKKYTKYSTYYTYIKDYNKHIRPYFDKKSINSINIPTYNLWWLEMAKKGYSVKYLNKINSLLRNIFNYGIQSFGLEFNPVVKNFKDKNDKITTEKLRYITKEEFDKFIGVVDDPLYHLLFNTLFYTGIRKGELLCLTWNDIDLQNKVMIINKTLYKIHENAPTSNKNNQSRQIYLNDSLVQEMACFKAKKEVYKDFSNNWYVFGDVFTLSTTTIERKKHHYFALSGVREITIHEFRHSHVSMLVNEYIKKGGKDGRSFLISVSARLGHTIPVMFKTYLHLFPNTQNDIVNMLNNL